jgi:hypothetical protein
MALHRGEMCIVNPAMPNPTSLSKTVRAREDLGIHGHITSTLMLVVMVTLTPDAFSKSDDEKWSWFGNPSLLVREENRG